MTSTTQKPSKQTQKGTQASKLVESLVSGAIDQRTTLFKNFRSAQQIINVDHSQMSQCLLKNLLSAYSVAQSAIMSELIRGGDVIVDGQLHPLYEQLKACEASVLRITKALSEQQHKAKPRSTRAKSKADDGSTIDIATLFSDDEVSP